MTLKSLDVMAQSIQDNRNYLQRFQQYLTEGAGGNKRGLALRLETTCSILDANHFITYVTHCVRVVWIEATMGLFRGKISVVCFCFRILCSHIGMFFNI